MGTNYYLLKKVDFDPSNRLPAYLGCNDLKDEPIQLTNGWVWNNTYYSSIEELNKFFYQKIHIGKSSFGWRFSLCIYPLENPSHKFGEYYHEYYLDKPIENLEDWIELFNDFNNVIVDEEFEYVSKEKMIEIITQRVGSVESDEEGYSLENDYCKARHRVINGLCVHDRERFVKVIVNKLKKKIYAIFFFWVIISSIEQIIIDIN